MAEYLIQDTTLTSLADKIRVLSGTEGTMMPSQMIANVQSANDEIDVQSALIDQLIAALEGKVTGGSGGDSSGSDDGGDVDWSQYSYALYNDVRLPKIPADVLAEYPYCIIAFFNSTYRLIMTKNIWFRKSDGYLQVQKCPNADFTYNESDWGTGNYYDSIGNWPSSSLIWSNHDIPNGSATATDIYFEGSDPVPTE